MTDPAESRPQTFRKTGLSFIEGHWKFSPNIFREPTVCAIVTGCLQVEHAREARRVRIKPHQFTLYPRYI
jgi:hypothetical protein